MVNWYIFSGNLSCIKRLKNVHVFWLSISKFSSHAWACVRTCVCTCVRVHMCMYMCKCALCVHTCVHVRVCTCVCTCVRDIQWHIICMNNTRYTHRIKLSSTLKSRFWRLLKNPEKSHMTDTSHIAIFVVHTYFVKTVRCICYICFNKVHM